MLQEAEFLRRPAVASVITLLAIVAAAPALAHDMQDSFEMTVVRDAAWGSKVTNGDYAEAIAKISAAGDRASQRFFRNNNLCVAYAKSKKIDAALDACNAALSITKADPSATTGGRRDRQSFRSRNERRHQAMALSNRGVLRVVSGDIASARDDFEAALALDTGISAPARNLALLESEFSETIAGVSR